MRKIFTKNKIILLLISILIGYLFLYSEKSIHAGREAIAIFANSVLPSLFPFFVLSGILLEMGIVEKLSIIFAPLMKTLFKVSGSGAYPFILSLICGYPLGSKTVCDLYRDSLLKKEESEILLSLCSTPNPIFVVGTLCTSFLNIESAPFIILISLYSGVVLTGIIKSFTYKNVPLSPSKITYRKKQNLLLVFASSIKNSILNLGNILAYIMFFMVLISFLDTLILSNLTYLNLPYYISSFVTSFIKGLFEMTIGLKSLALNTFLPTPILLSLCVFILSFSGLCINMQCIAFIIKTDLSIKKFMFFKVLQGVVSASICYTLSSFFPFSEKTISLNGAVPKNNIHLLLWSLFFILALFLFSTLIKEKFREV